MNVPPNKRGLFSEPDEKRLREFDAALREIFKTDYAQGAKATASSMGNPIAKRSALMSTDSRNFPMP